MYKWKKVEQKKYYCKHHCLENKQQETVINKTYILTRHIFIIMLFPAFAENDSHNSETDINNILMQQCLLKIKISDLWEIFIMKLVICMFIQIFIK